MRGGSNHPGKAAFDYLVGEKLINFADAATRHPQFASELPAFISRVRTIFTPDEIGENLAQIECEQRERDAGGSEEDDPFRETPVAAAERVRQFMTIKELLTTDTLGTS